MDLKHLKTFVKIVDSGSFTGAAEALGYTQSNITAHFQQLEAELGMPLLDRAGRKLSLTEEGREVYRRAVEMLNIAENMGEIKDLNGPLTGSLRIAAPESMMATTIEPVLKSFFSQNKQVSLAIANCTCDDAYQKLIEGECDLALMFLPVRNDVNLEIIPIREEPLALIAPFSLNKNKLDDFVAQDALAVPLIVNEKECCYRTGFEQYLIDRKISCTQKLEIWGIESTKRLVRDGVGISVLPESCAAREIEAGDLKRIKLDPEIKPVTLYLVYFKNRYRTRVARAFIDDLQSRI
jgi:DNA-binding transcriptional LysR family regulator